ncbi:MAG TPA: hypothetical protein VF456_16090 [Vicinamibacterales bacterium]
MDGARQLIDEPFKPALRSNRLAPKTTEHLQAFDLLAKPTAIVTGRIVFKDEDEIKV